MADFCLYWTNTKKEITNMIIDEGKLEWITINKLHDIRLVPGMHAWIDQLWQHDKIFFAKEVYGNNYKLKKPVTLSIL